MGAEPPAALIRELAAMTGPQARPVVLIDGRSGSGKTTLACVLSVVLGAELIRMDGLYPGWDGLEAGSRHVEEFLLDTDRPRWRAWDWERDRPGDWHAVDPRAPLIVEGAGALSRANRAQASHGIWVKHPDGAVRRARALARDGETYAPNWDRWAEQEARFIARERPATLADVIVESAGWTWRAGRAGAERRPPRGATGSTPTSTPGR